jgi:hypothetical protein
MSDSSGHKTEPATASSRGLQIKLPVAAKSAKDGNDAGNPPNAAPGKPAGGKEIHAKTGPAPVNAPNMAKTTPATTPATPASPPVREARPASGQAQVASPAQQMTQAAAARPQISAPAQAPAASDAAAKRPASASKPAKAKPAPAATMKTAVKPAPEEAGKKAGADEEGEEGTQEIRRENFIPVSRIALIDRLDREEKKSAGEQGHASCKNLFRYLSVWRHQSYQKRLARLKKCYLPFSPDRDTKRIMEYDEAELDALQNGLVEEVTTLVTQANFVEIDKEKLEELLQTNSAHGMELTVDLSEFEEVMLFARGLETEIIHKRVPDNLYLFKREFKVPVYKRLFLLLKLKSVEQRVSEIMEARDVSRKKALRINRKQRRGLPDDPEGKYIYLRMFKDIPQEDLEMMFPNTQIKLRLFDKIKLGVTAGGGTVAGIAGAASKMAAAVAAANPIGMIAGLVGIVGVIFRQIMNIFNTRTKYMMKLAQRLFFHSLANNRGVITLLVDRAEEQDIKEEMLLYFFLLRHPMPKSEMREGGWLDRLVEEFLAREFKVTVDFEIEDALSRLRADHLIMEEDGENGIVRAMPPEKACQHLERKWRALLASDENGAEEEYEEEV